VIMAVGLAALAWVVLVGPDWGTSTVDLGSRLVAAAYPAGDVVLLALLARLAVLPGGGRVPALLLGGAFLVSLVADGLFQAAVTDRSGAALTFSPMADAGWMLAYALVGAAALHPTMRALSDPTDEEEQTTGRGARLVAVTLLIAPAVLVGRLVQGAPVEVWVAASAGAVIAVLTALRLVRVGRWSDERGRTACRAAGTDLTTGLLTGPRLERELPRVLSGHDGRAALVVLDLDRFCEINATFGHALGDGVLREVGARLVRVAGPAAVVARWGGDEFAVVVPGAGEDDAAVLARDLRDALTEPVVVDDLTVQVEVSVGYVVGPVDGSDPAALLRRADAALVGAKRERGRLARYDLLEDRRTVLGGSLARDLREAVDRGQVVLHFQPIVDVRTGEGVAVEALVRWEHPEHGLLGPDAFVPAAERTGSIALLTRCVLEQALGAVAGWRAEGRDLVVTVNLSAQSLRDHQVVGDVRAALARHRVPGAALKLEITETTAMLDAERSVDVLAALAEVGVGLSLDDYGTGYSSLAYLQRMPVDQLKLDRAFVGRMAAHEPSEAIVRSTIELGHRLGLTVVAEGVEDEETYQMLAAMGCRAAQGFGVARPVAAEVVGAVLDGLPRRTPHVPAQVDRRRVFRR
jgi:diguanylate cyclase